MAVPKKLWLFAVIGVCVHLLLLSAVFDIYFVSPIQHGMTPHKTKGQAPARRLVLFVADGLRADSLYNSQMEENSPYLHSVKEIKGTWGISHTQVPTESRPGHIAILAGFNEDPSAITRGWQSNPVNFDSVINQSTNAWCWGSPDIVNMFNKYNLPHIHLYAYDAYMQDFSGKESPVLLDEWVFDKVHEFIKNQKPICKDLCRDGNILFLHLLGLDTAGHSIKPTSPKYIENIKAVDKGIESIVLLIEKYFGDRRTAYIFTSDHGMTNWGSHGDGSLHETEVPFIAWGSSIPRGKGRYDLQQADIAPLMSSLVGINIPINSVGVVPLSYLDISEFQKANILRANVLQLSEQYIMKHRNLKNNTISLIFRPYPEIPSESSFSEKLAMLNGLLEAQQYQQAITSSYDLITLFKDGLKYYYNYYQRVLLVFVTTGFVGWIVYLFSSITDLNTLAYVNCQWCVSRYPLIPKTPFILFGLVLSASLLPFIYTMPLLYYVYCYFPIFTWLMVVKNYRQVLTNSILLGTCSWKKLMFTGSVYLMGIELLILTFFKPYYLSFVFVFFAFHALIKKSNELSALLWIFIQLLLGMSPMMLKMQTEFNVFIQIFGYGLWLYYGYTILITPSFRPDRPVFMYQFLMLTLAFMNSLCVHITIKRGIGLLLVNQLLSWLLLAISFIFPMLVSPRLENRVVSAIMSLMIPYTLMAVGYESIFMFFFAQHMVNWLSIEYLEMKVKHPNDPPLEHFLTTSLRTGYTDKGAIKRCYYLLTFIMLSYFGVGNTGSMSSFDPMWVRCFVTVFSPFTMTGLILIKLVIPFLLVMCAFRGVMIITRSQMQNTFLIILLFCDIMVLQFLYFVKNEGSWLEIGISLSRFIVANITTIMLLLLYQIAIILTSKDLRKHSFAKYLKKYFGIYTLNEF